MLPLLLACASPPPVAEAPLPPEPPPPAPRFAVEAIEMPGIDHFSKGVTFGPGGTRLATEGYHPTPDVRVWSHEDGRRLARIGLYASGFDLTPDGRFAVLGRKEVATVWDLDRGRAVRHLGGHWDWVEQVAVHPDGEQVFTYDDTPSWHRFDLHSGRRLAKPPAPTSLVRASAVSSTHLIWCAIGDPFVRRWHIEREAGEDLPLDTECATLATTPDGTVIAAALPAGRLPGKNAAGTRVAVWSSGELVRTVDGLAYQLALTPDGRVLLASWEDRISMVEIATGEQVGVIEVGSQVRDMAVSADHVLAVVHHPGEVSLWRLRYP